MGYFRRVLSRSWKETGAIWTAYRWWLALAPILSGAALAWFEGKNMTDAVLGAALGAALGASVAFVGSFVLSFVRAPKLLDDDRAEQIRKLAPPDVELARRELLTRLLGGYSEDGKDCLRIILLTGPVKVYDLRSRCTPVGLKEVASRKSSGDGIVTESGTGAWDISPALKNALGFHLLNR